MTTEARSLAAAFARKLTAAGCPEPDVLAVELAAIAQMHGWRPVEALRTPADGTPADPAVAAQCAAEARAQLRGGTP